MDLQKFKDKMQTENALPLNILLDEAQNIVHKNGSIEVDAAGEFMQDVVDKLSMVKMICKDLRTGEMPVDDNPVKNTPKVFCKIDTDVQAGDYITLRRIGDDGSVMATFSGQIGLPSIYPTHKEALFLIKESA